MGRKTQRHRKAAEIRFRLEEGDQIDVAPVERHELLELMGERSVSVVERLRPVVGERRASRSAVAAISADDVTVFTGALVDVVLTVVPREGDAADVHGVVLPPSDVDLAGADRGYLDGFIANLWSETSRSQTVSELGEFAFANVQAGPAEIAFSFGGHLMLADLTIAGRD